MPAQNTIKCSKCGRPKGTTNVRLKALIKKFGSKAKFLKQYVCRDCKNGNANVKAGRKRNSKLPTSKVICSKCKGKFGTTKTRMDKLIATYGSLELVHSTYVCRKCRKEHNVDKRGRYKAPKKKRIPKATSNFERDKSGEVILPQWMAHFVPRERHRCTAEELGKIPTCWRPDIWSDNDRACNGPNKLCPHYQQISCSSEQVACKVKKTKVKKYKPKKKSKKKKK